MATPDGWAGTRAGMSAPGVRAQYRRTVSIQAVGDLTRATGNRHPLHDEGAVARASRFGGLTVPANTPIRTANPHGEAYRQGEASTDAILLAGR
ncbi:hypothetical protein [Pseudoxanthomonas sp. JBR18]|uniref:hypothetical protein n=1 Tax=Pseudoxanthomonas sp. JBR18 TaxID=2969308 RepID=UPI002306B74A|nr:hypothetical protein [Pseudoxanthomonas sp. JBR18]WCE02713.1 hypothetical protein PJ250_11180 [Pseudoxanthomonas sp. JBR18]